jgi:hypothetical protein
VLVLHDALSRLLGQLTRRAHRASVFTPPPGRRTVRIGVSTSLLAVGELLLQKPGQSHSDIGLIDTARTKPGHDCDEVVGREVLL